MCASCARRLLVPESALNSPRLRRTTSCPKLSGEFIGYILHSGITPPGGGTTIWNTAGDSLGAQHRAMPTSHSSIWYAISLFFDLIDIGYQSFSRRRILARRLTHLEPIIIQGIRVEPTPVACDAAKYEALSPPLVGC